VLFVSSTVLPNPRRFLCAFGEFIAVLHVEFLQMNFRVGIRGELLDGLDQAGFVRVAASFVPVAASFVPVAVVIVTSVHSHDDP
jgi:hypothetical protein